jgi:tRNA A37 N6-isopentenylltransferase MiaA
MVQLLNGELSPRDAVFYAQRNTRHYAKRPLTWFRKEVGMQWLKGFGDSPEICERAIASVSCFLTNDPRELAEPF